MRMATVDERHLARRQSVLSLVTPMGPTLPVRCNLIPPPAFPQHRCEPCVENLSAAGVRGMRHEERGAMAKDAGGGGWQRVGGTG